MKLMASDSVPRPFLRFRSEGLPFLRDQTRVSLDSRLPALHKIKTNNGIYKRQIWDSDGPD